MIKREMPVIDLSQVEMTDDERAIAVLILNGSRLRASKPPLKSDTHRNAAYVWRNVAFFISPVPQHQCMPMTADFDLPREFWDYETRHAYTSPTHEADSRDCHDRRMAHTKKLDDLVKRIVDAVPQDEWNGVKRWGQAYGVIGRPQATETGEIIYR